MHTAKRAMRRLALVGCLGLFGAAMSAAPAPAATPPERVLPDSTIFLFKINDTKAFREAFRGSHYGQLWHDPAMKDFRDDLSQKFEDLAKPLKEKIGLSLQELLQLPQGPIAVALLSRDDPKLPVAIVVMADAGANKDKLADVLNKATKQAEEHGAKASQETFNGLTLHILREAADEKPKEKDQAKAEGGGSTDMGAAWAESEGVFYFSFAAPGGETEVLKDLTAHKEGRDNALAGNESFNKTQAKIESAKAQVVWFLDVAKIIKIALKASAKGNEGQMQQNEVYVQQLGFNGLKSIGGSFAFNSGNYDSLSKTFFLAPKPVHGVLKIFSFPPVRLRPEAWVPATLASYQSMSWDLDNAYDAIEAIINKFQPGMLNLIEQQLVGPNGGQPLSFKNDFFGPIGDRLTLISDFKKPIKEDSQRLPAGHRARGRQGLPGDAQSDLRDHPELAQEAGVPGHHDLRRGYAQYAQSQCRRGAAVQGSDQLRGRQEHVLRHHGHHPAGAGAPAGQRRAGGERRVPVGGEGDPRARQRDDLRPPGRVGPPALRPGQERPVRESHSANARRQRPGTAAAAGPPARQGDPQRKAPRVLRPRQVPLPRRELQRHGR